MQGVCYRLCARDEAQRLGLAGWVRNLPDGGVEILGSMQCPFYVLNALCRALGLARDRIVVRQSATGGAFGGKEDQATPWAVMAALGAHLLGRPVRIELDRGALVLNRLRSRIAVQADGGMRTGRDVVIAAAAARPVQAATGSVRPDSSATPAAASRVAFSMVATRLSKLAGRWSVGSSMTGTRAAASASATSQASAPPVTASANAAARISSTASVLDSARRARRR